MPDVFGIEFNANQSELVREIVGELLKDGNCAAYPVPHIKPHGELRMASTPPIHGQTRQRGIFLRIRPGVNEATILRPMNAKAGDPLTKLNKLSRLELLSVIRVWRQQTMPKSRNTVSQPGFPCGRCAREVSNAIGVIALQAPASGLHVDRLVMNPRFYMDTRFEELDYEAPISLYSKRTITPENPSTCKRIQGLLCTFRHTHHERNHLDGSPISSKSQ